MRKTHYYIVLLAVSGLLACNSATDTASTSDTAVLNPGDSAVTTTTTVTHHRYAGTFVPKPEVKYIDLQTRQQVTVRIDTERGEVVNAETNQPIYLFVEPATHDTIYGQTGNVVNNYITKEEGGAYRVDTVRIYETNTVTATPPDEPAQGKTKTKVKTDDMKVKEKTK